MTKPYPTPALLSAATISIVAVFGPITSVAAEATWKPDRPVTLVVPYGPGGGTDTTARAAAKVLGEQWGQPVLVNNVPGADGLIGTRRVIDAKPDGYTILIQTPAVVLTKHAPSFSGDDPLSNLTPITNIAQAAGVIVSTSKFPANTFPELISYCKTAAKPCSMGTGENVAKLFGTQLQEQAIPNLIVANYKGTGGIITDMLGNNIDFSITGMTAVAPFLESGQLKVIASQGQDRQPKAPDVPTVFEMGMPEYEYSTWFGLLAPKGTPANVTNGIYEAVKAVINTPELKTSIATAGAVPLVNTPEEFAAQIQKEDKRFIDLAKRYPLK